MTPDHHGGGSDVDDLIRATRRSFMARHDATFDFDAGLADVRERAVALACDHIDGFVALLGEALLVAEIRDLTGLHIQRAVGVLVQVRSHVAAGSMSAAAAAEAFAEVSAALGRADLITTTERHSIASRLRDLEHEVAALLAPDGHGRDDDRGRNDRPRSTSRRWPDDPAPGRRSAEGSDQ